MGDSRGNGEEEPAACQAFQRLDKWIWFARVVKTRSLAAKLALEGHVRVNGERSLEPSKRVYLGDVLTLSLERRVRVLRVRGLGERRGPFSQAQTLFEDLSEPG